MTPFVLKIVYTWHQYKVPKINPRKLKIALNVLLNVFKNLRNVAISVVKYLRALTIIVVIVLIVFLRNLQKMI